jgi:hypothetical protein
MMLDRTHASISQSGEGTPRAMLAETMKIPDPIIDPATSIVASVRDIALTNPVPGCGVASVDAAELLMQSGEKARRTPTTGAAAFSGDESRKM